ncbi:MAG: DUF3127 domain-containing protein [Bacteroidales bacterium]|jgi:hypothetical protein|nr:DUF3127 domain-containing protein [Bacteroidales bacterium]MBQ5689692.1 DUF3127 domain-containing protein [Bacteroidales bacterium]
MEIQGKVVRLGNLTEGTSPRGAWRKQELIIETIEQYPKQVCLVCWGDRVAEAQNFTPGQTIKAQISIESREFNGKWYTDVRPFRFDIEMPQQAQPMQQPMQQAPEFAAPQPQNNIPVTEYFATDNGDDLPF